MAEMKGRYAFNEVVIEPLTRDNHVAWFAWVKNYLMARDLWNMIDGTFEKPPENEDHKEDFVRWRRMNAAALHVIQISCTPKSFNHIIQVSEAKVAWDILNCIYNPPPLTQEPPPQVGFNAGTLYKAIHDNDWLAAKTSLGNNVDSALGAKINARGYTALHVAALLGHVQILEELVERAPAEYLEILDDADGYTPLAVAATFSGDIRVAQCMLEKNENILGIPTPTRSLPVTLALRSGHKEMGHYLYSRTPLEILKPDKGPQGPWLLHICFISEHLDIAVNLLRRCEELHFALDHTGWAPIMGIAAMPSAFPSGSKLVFWKQWIYDYIKIKSITSIDAVHMDIQEEDESKTQGRGLQMNREDESERTQGLGQLMKRAISFTYNLLGITQIYKLKLLHEQANEILSIFCKKLPYMDSKPEWQTAPVLALFCAAKEGIVEFVDQVTKASPSIVLLSFGPSPHLFFNAIKYRKVEVFNLFKGTPFKNALASKIEEHSGNNMLHVAAMLSPSSQLNGISGAALQMQSELQWFKEVKRVLPPAYRVKQNNDSMYPEDIFKESHKELRKEGEKWMKETASSCSVVGTLVVTIMFAVAFTVPGGNNQNSGYPIFLKDKLFLLFIISDALSLFSSTTAVLMFLGMLTSRYAEEDFLISLPTKLIIGLFTLFLSIVTMMIAFSACILVMLEHSYSWAPLPVIMLASVPITLFVLLQSRLLVQMYSSTCGRGMFKRKANLRSRERRT